MIAGLDAFRWSPVAIPRIGASGSAAPTPAREKRGDK